MTYGYDSRTYLAVVLPVTAQVHYLTRLYRPVRRKPTGLRQQSTESPPDKRFWRSRQSPRFVPSTTRTAAVKEDYKVHGYPAYGSITLMKWHDKARGNLCVRRGLTGWYRYPGVSTPLPTRALSFQAAVCKQIGGADDKPRSFDAFHYKSSSRTCDVANNQSE